MAKIKLTKSELKTQRDALKQFARYLPTLQLKKQQLQMEVMKSQELLRKNREKEEEKRNKLSSWISMFGTDNIDEKFLSLISVKEIVSSRQNIAGVDVPVFKEVIFNIEEYDLFIEDLWIYDGIKAIQDIISIKAEYEILEEQTRLIQHELRVTTQRVNLFEKVKIPECKENIRKIQIYLGDQQTASVGRSKIAKRKMQEGVA